MIREELHIGGKMLRTVSWEYADILSESNCVKTTLEWNSGNHFVDADKLTAKAFLWAMNHTV